MLLASYEDFNWSILAKAKALSPPSSESWFWIPSISFLFSLITSPRNMILDWESSSFSWSFVVTASLYASSVSRAALALFSSSSCFSELLSSSSNDDSLWFFTLIVFSSSEIRSLALLSSMLLASYEDFNWSILLTAMAFSVSRSESWCWISSISPLPLAISPSR